MSAVATEDTQPAPRLHVMPIAKPAKPGLHANWLLMLIACGALATVSLWWRNTPSINGIGDWLTNAGRVTGLLAGYAIVVLLGLMARVPAVERGVGADRLARWHSMGGRYTVSLVTAHALLITWGYAVTDRTNVFSETWMLWTEYADVLMATVALGLLLLVGITSARAARKRLRYETWMYIHFYTYLATALAFSHQFATGAEFVNNPLARVFWATMYAIVAALVIWYRFTAPIRQSLRHKLHVKAVIPESPTITTVIIGGRNLHELEATSGQFFRWRILNRNGWWTANPYSLSAPPTNDELRITVKALGDHSASTNQIIPGTRVIAEGPYGAMTTARSNKKRVLLIAGGVGVTPLRALFEDLSRERGADVIMLYRASSESDVLFRNELDGIALHYGSQVRYLVGPRNSSVDIIRPGQLDELIPSLRNCDIYICGPTGMTQSATAAVRRLGAKRRNIHLEDFTF